MVVVMLGVATIAAIKQSTPDRGHTWEHRRSSHGQNQGKDHSEGWWPMRRTVRTQVDVRTETQSCH